MWHNTPQPEALSYMRVVIKDFQGGLDWTGRPFISKISEVAVQWSTPTSASGFAGSSVNRSDGKDGQAAMRSIIYMHDHQTFIMS